MSVDSDTDWYIPSNEYSRVVHIPLVLTGAWLLNTEVPERIMRAFERKNLMEIEPDYGRVSLN